MHMADALISPAVGGVMFAVSTGAVAYSVRSIKIELQEHEDDRKVPVMGVMGAFVFAAQMINFIIPATGSSGHMAGGILLAALLGPYAGLLVLTTVLLIQALFFADGGLLALGCNIFNMGIVSCLVVYPLLFRPLIEKGITKQRITVASIVSGIVALQLGAFSVVLETVASGRTELPFLQFALLMQPIHLFIGIAEGVITATVLYFINQADPGLFFGISENRDSRCEESDRLPKDKTGRKSAYSFRTILAILLVTSILLGGFVSGFASASPDGLEWSIERSLVGSLSEPLTGFHQILSDFQERTSFLPDYLWKRSDTISDATQTGTAGLIGGGITLLLVLLIGFLIKKSRRQDIC